MPAVRRLRPLAALSRLAVAAAAAASLASCGGGGAPACSLQPTACAAVGPGCAPAPLPEGTAAGDPTPGDCQRLVCDGAGHPVGAADDADLPSGTPCRPGSCSGGVPAFENAPPGTACGAGQVCDGTGTCLVGARCDLASDCPGTDASCTARSCDDHLCGLAHAPAGTPCEGGLQCNGAGLCGCRTVADCPGAGAPCATHDCMAGVCLGAPEPAGTPVSDPTPGDCQSLQCDGNAHVVLAPDDRDLPVDGNPCTLDRCIAGAPWNGPAAAGEPCPGGTCDGAGTCLLGHLNGCAPAIAVDRTASTSVTVAFPGSGPSPDYSPRCLAVRVGASVTFAATPPASFAEYPLQGGVLVMGVLPVPAASGPFVPATGAGNSATFPMSAAGDFPYYCAAAGVLMAGVVYVLP